MKSKKEHKLTQWLQENRWTLRSFSLHLNQHAQYLYSIVSGKTDPKLSVCMEIERITLRKVKCQDIAELYLAKNDKSSKAE